MLPDRATELVRRQAVVDSQGPHCGQAHMGHTHYDIIIITLTLWIALVVATDQHTHTANIWYVALVSNHKGIKQGTGSNKHKFTRVLNQHLIVQ